MGKQESFNAGLHSDMYKLFLIHTSIMQTCVMSCACPYGWPAILHGKIFNIGHYTNYSTNFLIPAMLIGTIDFYDFYHFITLTDLDLVWGSQVWHEVKPTGFIFSHTFHLSRMKFDVVMKQFKLNIVRLLLSRIYGNEGSNCCFC